MKCTPRGPRRPARPLLLLSSLALTALVACGDGAETEPAHRLSLTARMHAADDGMVPFVSPAGSVISHTPEAIAGRPYLVAVYPAGFSVGNDPELHGVVGVVPDDLIVEYQSPAMFADGAYDVVLAVYVNTELSEAQMAGELDDMPAPVAGDLATFTLDMSAVREGDPSIPPGLVRLNVEGGDAAIEVANRVPSETVPVAEAMADTIMIIP